MAKPLTFRGTPHNHDAPTLSLADVSVAYTSVGSSFSRDKTTVFALKNATFQAEQGEQIAIIGPNGAGKSTLLKVAAGILKPDQGTVSIFDSAPDTHICIAYVPQRSEIDWTFPVTVSDVVLMGRTKQIGLFRRPNMADYDIVNASLARVQATHLANEQIGELSGGQQQRVFIARALAMDAHLILMDEPLAGLDIPSQEKIFDVLATLREEKVTVMFATHDLGMAADRFDRVMLLNKSIVALGPAKEVLTSANLLAAYGGQVSVRSTDTLEAN